MVNIEQKNIMVASKIKKEIEEINNFVENMTEEDFLANKKNIPWKDIRATRNIVAHNYESVDMPTIWDTVKVYLPTLKNELNS